MSKTLKQVRAGRLVYAVVYTTPTAGDSPKTRAQKQKTANLARERLNARTSFQKLERTLAANFDTGDLLVTLTYDDKNLPADRDKAVKKVRAWIPKLRRARKARGEELHYIYVTECQSSKEKRLHHHMVLNSTGEDLEEIQKLWRYGNVEVQRLKFDQFNTYEELASYLTKEPREHGHPNVGERTWTPSLGLKQPEPQTETVPDYVTLTAPPEAVILQSDGPHRNGFGEYMWIKYMLPRNPDRRRPKSKRRAKRKK